MSEGFKRDALPRFELGLFLNVKRSIVVFHRLNPNARSPTLVAPSAAAASSTIRRSAGFRRQNLRHVSILVFNPTLPKKSHGRAVRAKRAGKACHQWPKDGRPEGILFKLNASLRLVLRPVPRFAFSQATRGARVRIGPPRLHIHREAYPATR
jgi:hypothetical protein